VHFLLNAKPGDHENLFEQVEEAMERDDYLVESLTVAKARKKVQTQTQYISDMAINKSNEKVRVNFLQHLEFDSDSFEVIKRFSWVTDLELSAKSLDLYPRGGRCRWRVENETFNTLKNQDKTKRASESSPIQMLAKDVIDAPLTQMSL
jgi:hypothetical protein